MKKVLSIILLLIGLVGGSALFSGVKKQPKEETLLLGKEEKVLYKYETTEGEKQVKYEVVFKAMNNVNAPEPASTLVVATSSEAINELLAMPNPAVKDEHSEWIFVDVKRTEL